MDQTIKPKIELDPNKPAYECPKCHQQAMQFFRVDPKQPLREDTFVCKACGNNWQI